MGSRRGVTIPLGVLIPRQAPRSPSRAAQSPHLRKGRMKKSAALKFALPPPRPALLCWSVTSLCPK
jgi:hypothetical protein